MIEWKEWAKDTSEYKEVQTLLMELLEKLIGRYFPDAGDYVQEKFVKAFSEPIGLLERNMLYKRGIHHSKLEKKGYMLNQHERDKLFRDVEEVKNILLTELKRQYRHFDIFLCATATKQENKK